ncbi:MAG: MFS transporter [Armatimonadota bacterium]|nr:MFS transporter [bacterium]MDW8322043.1 MFS transporter [Armatimonadota bacterium]
MEQRREDNSGGTSPSAVALWHNSVYRTYWVGSFISFIGSWMQTVAQGWVVYEITNSKLLLGLLGFLGSLPTTLFSLFGGVVADRFEKRKLVITTQALFALNAFVLSFLVLTGRVEFWHIALIAALNGLIVAIDAPARQAMVMDLVGGQFVTVGVAMNSAAFNTARILGPAIAGKLIEVVNAGWCFFINAVSYLAIIFSLWRMPATPSQGAVERLSVWLELREGLGYVYRDGLLRSLVLLDCALSIFAMSYTTLMPVFARDILQVGKQGLGNLYSATGFGALMGALVLARVAGTVPRGKVVIAAATGLCSSLLLFALSRSYLLSLGCLVLVGGCGVSTLGSINALLQSLSPEHLRGRTMSLHVFALMGLAPFGNLLMGWLASHWTATLALVTGAAVCAAAVGLTALRRDVRQLPAV